MGLRARTPATVNTFSICHVNWDASRIPEGEPLHLPAVIEIDGASIGMGILHMLGEVDPEDIKIGMKVKAVWKSPGTGRAPSPTSCTSSRYAPPGRSPAGRLQPRRPP